MPNVHLVDTTCCAELRHLAFHDIRRINNGILILETGWDAWIAMARETKLRLVNMEIVQFIGNIDELPDFLIAKFKAAILEAGLKWTPLSLSAQELEFIAARQFQVQEIARMFRIPPHMIGELSRSTNNNITQQSQEYVNFTVSGYTRRWKAKLRKTFELRQAGDIQVDYDLSELVRADIVARYNAYRVAIMSGWMKPNEARLDDGRDPDPKGNELLQPSNMAGGGSQSTGTKADDGGRPEDGTVNQVTFPNGAAQ